jgi:hypothetical protein
LSAEIAVNSHFCYALSWSNIEFTSSSGTIPEGKHVMLSYNSNSQGIVSKICHYLQDEHMQVWFEEQLNTKDDIYDRYELRK